MSTLRQIALLTVATGLFYGCVKEDSPVTPEPLSASTTLSTPGILPQARYAGPDYSQSIPIDDANYLIGSYLESVGYPNEDSALRSLTFDADTLRSYLQDTSIVTLKFFIAHTPAYAGNSATYGKYAGMNPNAMTLVVAGLNSRDNYVRSSRNGFYEHFNACPLNCPASVGAGALLQ